MRFAYVPALAVAALLAGPAWAQQQNPEAQAGQQMQAQTGQQGQQSQQASTQMRDQLRQTLQQVGFTNVQILDTAYLVQADSPHGETVIMMVNPPPMSAGMSGSGTGTTAGAAGGSGGGTSGGGGTQQGTQGTNQ